MFVSVCILIVNVKFYIVGRLLYVYGISFYDVLELMKF